MDRSGMCEETATEIHGLHDVSALAARPENISVI
jgi:hypothetical protein